VVPTVAQSTTLDLFHALNLGHYQPDEKPPPFMASTVEDRLLLRADQVIE
jgi:hypothetical protein